jgi:hypothetical protein
MRNTDELMKANIVDLSFSYMLAIPRINLLRDVLYSRRLELGGTKPTLLTG